MSETLTIEELGRIAHDTLTKGTTLWLYGSRARGEARPDSDWDLLILVDKPKVEGSDFDNISFPLIMRGWNYGADLSPQVYTRKEWQRMKNTPYWINVERDKKVIYES